MILAFRSKVLTTHWGGGNNFRNLLNMEDGFMETIEFSDRVKMLPLVGENYDAMEKKIMIMGESMYNGGIVQRTSKNQIVRRIKLLDKYPHKYYTLILKIFNMIDRTKKYDSSFVPNKEDFWNSIAYYEYIQRVLKSKEDRPSDSDWENAKEAFIEVCSKLKPDIIVCIGYGTFDHLPKEYGEECKSIKLKKYDEQMDVWKYDKKIKSKTIKDPVYVCRVKHVSAPGFASEEWFDLFTKFLDSVAKENI